MDTKVKQYLQVCRQFIEWDPTRNTYEDVAEKGACKADLPNLHKAMVSMAKDCWGLTITLEQAELTPFFNFLYVAYDLAEPKDLEALWKGGKDARGRYMSVIDPVPEFIKAAEKVTKEFYELKPRKKETQVGKVTLKPFDSVAHDTMVSSTLKANGMPAWGDILSLIEDIQNDNKLKELEDQKDEALTLADSLKSEVDRLKPLLADLQQKVNTTFTPIEVPATDEIPAGKYTLKKISELFPDIHGSQGKKAKFDRDWEVPYWEWEGVHPLVPKADPHYIFRKTELVAVLYAIVTNQRAYLQGDTGSGKTTLIEQVCAVLNWPFVRINFDSEITRMDLIGRDTLKTEDGKTISEFVDGILPRAMQSPCIACFDEFDFVRPDVAYVMQAATEGNGLRITEDGDRFVQPHPMFRMFATGNTVGQGDEDGLYQGARPQSMALLDRFTVWVNVDYLSEKQRRELIERHFPSLTEADLNPICLYVNEHLAAFRQAEVTQPISPRGMLAIARATSMTGDPKSAVTMTVLNRANKEDRVTLNGIVNRVFK